MASSGLLSSLAGLDDRGQSVTLVWDFALAFVTGLVIFFIAPMVFQRLGLAERTSSSEPTPTTV